MFDYYNVKWSSVFEQDKWKYKEKNMDEKTKKLAKMCPDKKLPMPIKPG